MTIQRGSDKKKKRKGGLGLTNGIVPMGKPHYIHIKPDTSTTWISNRAIRGSAKWVNAPLINVTISADQQGAVAVFAIRHPESVQMYSEPANASCDVKPENTVRIRESFQRVPQSPLSSHFNGLLVGQCRGFEHKWSVKTHIYDISR